MKNTETDQKPQNSRQIQSYIFAGILILLLIFVLRLFSPFFTVLLWSTLLYIIISPLHRRIIKRLDSNTRKGKVMKNVWAVIFALGTILIILLPLLFIIFLFFKQALELGQYLQNLLSESPDYLHKVFIDVSNFIRSAFGNLLEIDADTIIQELKKLISSGLSFAGTMSTGIAMNIGSFLLNILMMLFTLFFLYVDGPYLTSLFLRAIPIKKEYTSTLSAKFLDITRNLIFGYIIVALLQSVVAYILFVIFGIRGSLVLAVITFFMTFIPIIGAGILYIPLGFIIIAQGHTMTGIVFLILCIVLISGIDTVVRPIFMRDRLNLHPLIIFFAILGGLSVFGFNGFILGPMIVILFLTVLNLFLIEHKLIRRERSSDH